MKRPITILLVALLAVLLPLRAIASVSIGLCAAAQEKAAAQAEQHHDHGSDASPHHEGQTDGAASHGCSSCAEHCTGVSFVPSLEARTINAGPGADPITFALRLRPGIVPGHLERPPLGS